MSLHYEWTLSLRLRPDVPVAFVEGLRYQLGLSGLVPPAPTLGWAGPALACAGGEALPGGPVTSLTEGWIGFAREELGLDRG